MTENTCGTLFVTGTPIGNLSDFSPRAVEALESADLIAAEDTRVTLKLLNHFDIKTPMVSYHEHNKNQKGPELLARILKGENCELTTESDFLGDFEFQGLPTNAFFSVTICADGYESKTLECKTAGAVNFGEILLKKL